MTSPTAHRAPGDPATWAAVDDYLEMVCGEDDALTSASAAAAAAGVPAIAVSATQGKLLQLLVRIHGAQRVLEVGTLAGYSAIWMARALTGDAPHLMTLELDPTHAAVARENIQRAGLGHVVEVREGPALDSLAALHQEGVDPFDVVFIDADKPSNPAYLQWAVALARPGAVIVVDNVVRRGAVIDADSTDASVRGSRAVLERAAADPRLQATAIQTVGSKGYDGFLLVRVDR